jgi:hypothetical protein
LDFPDNRRRGNQRVVYIINKVKQQQLLEAFTEVEDADDYDLSNKWNDLKVTIGESVYQGYDATHPLRFFIGLDSVGNREFFLIVNAKPCVYQPAADPLRYQVGLGKTEHIPWYSSLCNHTSRRFFTHLCWDWLRHPVPVYNKKKGCL